MAERIQCLNLPLQSIQHLTLLSHYNTYSWFHANLPQYYSRRQNTSLNVDFSFTYSLCSYSTSSQLGRWREYILSLGQAAGIKVRLSPSKTNFFICFNDAKNNEKCFLFHLKTSFCPQDI